MWLNTRYRGRNGHHAAPDRCSVERGCEFAIQGDTTNDANVMLVSRYPFSACSIRTAQLPRLLCANTRHYMRPDPRPATDRGRSIRDDPPATRRSCGEGRAADLTHLPDYDNRLPDLRDSPSDARRHTHLASRQPELRAQGPMDDHVQREGG